MDYSKAYDKKRKFDSDGKREKELHDIMTSRGFKFHGNLVKVYDVFL